MINPFTPQLGDSVTYKFDRGNCLPCIKFLPCPVSNRAPEQPFTFAYNRQFREHGIA